MCTNASLCLCLCIHLSSPYNTRLRHLPTSKKRAVTANWCASMHHIGLLLCCYDLIIRESFCFWVYGPCTHVTQNFSMSPAAREHQHNYECRATIRGNDTEASNNQTAPGSHFQGNCKKVDPNKEEWTSHVDAMTKNFFDMWQVEDKHKG